MKSKVITVIMILFLLLFVCASFYFFKIHSYNNTDIDDNTDNSPSKTVLPGDDEKIYNSIKNHPSDSVQVFPGISHENVKDLILSLEMPESYCWYYLCTLYSNSGSSSKNGILLSGGENKKFEIYGQDNVLEKIVTKENEEITVQSMKGGSAVASFSSTEFSIFGEAGVPDIATFTNNTSDDYEYSLIESNYGTLLYCEFESIRADYSQREEYFISLDYGIVVKAECYEKDKLIYSLETLALYELENQQPW